MATPHYYYGLGRRKTSTARVRLMNGKGNLTINGKEGIDYFDNSKYLLNELAKPFAVLELEKNKYDITVVVSGGGHHSQAEAIQLGIAKSLTALNEDYKQTLRRAELLGRDSRMRERKKPGLKSARKQRQFTKR